MAGAYDYAWRQVRLQALERDGYQCQLRLDGCTTHATHGDHIVPLSEGGARLDLTNIRAACEHCNLRRNTQRQAALAAHALRSTTELTTASRNW